MACPVYQRAGLAPLPPALAAAPDRAPLFNLSRGRVMGGLAALLLLAFLAVISLNLGRAAAARREAAQAAVPVTGEQAPVSPVVELSPSPDDRLFNFATPATQPPTRRNCTAPAGWGSYIVKPTDSLLSLSNLFGVTVEELQQANCLGSGRVVFPGELVYLPPQPTLVPTTVPTATRVIIYYQPSATSMPDDPGDQPPDPPEEPTAEPTAEPTNAPATPTVPPPSQTPPPPTVTPDPPGGGGGPPPTEEPRPTDAPKPTEEPRPTKEPKPTKPPKPTKEKYELPLLLDPLLDPVLSSLAL